MQPQAGGSHVTCYRLTRSWPRLVHSQ
jgi:hypothetical protein